MVSWQQTCLAYLLVLACTRSEGRDLTAEERKSRAAFVQRILNRYRSREGDVRLVGGRTRYEGNVYVRHAGRWGAVCDDSWGAAEAALVCRAHNRTGRPVRGAHFGLSASKYWMDDVTCEGSETSLSQCRFPGWGVADCSRDEIAGVVCEEPAASGVAKASESLTAPRALRVAFEGRALRLRLTGGRDRNEGRVEIRYRGVWGSVCGDGWSLHEALVVCRHLGLGYARAAPQGDAFGRSAAVLSGAACSGDERTFGECRHDRVGDVSCPGVKGAVAGVVCTASLADLALDRSELERSAHLQDVPMYMLRCAMEEMCLSESAYEVQRDNPDWQLETRRLLRFTAAAANVGTEDFRSDVPKHLWQWHLCHMHYHSMEVFATFDVLDLTGARVAQGHKASFCLEDNTCAEGIDKRYSCHNYGDQGISVNCTDIYRYNIDCQWVDISDLEPGAYKLRVAVNPHAKVPEQSYHNNAAVCDLLYTDVQARLYGCTLQRP